MTRASDTAKLLGAGATILDGTTISTADNDPQLILTSTDADATKGPELNLYRNSASPADGDRIGQFKFTGENDADEVVVFGQMHNIANDITDGTEDSTTVFMTMKAGTLRNRLALGHSETIFNDESLDLDFRVESNGNANMLFVNGGTDKVGIGTNDPHQMLGIESASNPAISIVDTTNNVECLIYADDSIVHMGSLTNHNLVFRQNNTERMRIDTGARLAFGNTDTNAKITVSQNGNALNLMRLQNTDGTDNARFIQFANDSNSDCGHIDQVNATTIAYNTTSDYRLKQNVAYTFDATTEVKKLKPCTFSWKHDATDKSVYGFLAHEVSGIVSEAVSGTKDATRDIGTIKNEDGEITAKNAPQVQANTDENETWEKTDTENVYQGYDAGKLVPLLVKTIQELEARITALESA